MATNAARAQAGTLDGLDASFLYAEYGAVLMHTLKVALLEPNSAERLGSSDDWAALRLRIASAVKRLPPLHRRLVSVPLGLHHPRWVVVAAVDIDRHLEHVDLGEQIERARSSESTALEAVLAKFAERPLPRHRPLWRVLIVSGLGEGRLAVAVKIHHALTDGIAAAELIRTITRDCACAWQPPLERDEPLSTAMPSRLGLLVHAIARRLGDLLHLPMLALSSIVRATRAIRLRHRARRIPPGLFAGPPTFFNRRLGHGRAIRRLQVPLATIKLVKARLDVGFNDVVLAVVAGAFARMRGRGLFEGPPLLVSMPIADGGDPRRVQGNHLSTGFTSLCDHIEDVGVRLQTIAETATVAKRAAEAYGLDQLRRWAEFDAPWWQHLAQRISRVSVSPPINLIVSNVAGPPEPRWLGRVCIDELWSFGPLVERVGVNVTAWSYASQLNFGIQADAGQWSAAQLDRLIVDMRDAAEELHGLATRTGPSLPPPISPGPPPGPPPGPSAPPTKPTLELVT